MLPNNATDDCPGSFAGTVSLVIAITGHRELHPDDVERAKEGVGKIFDKMKRDYPNTPLLLLSGLAQGADSIAVHVARHHQVPYMAVLPMPYDLYATDFKTDESRKELEELWNGTTRRIALPVVSGLTEAQVSSDTVLRKLQYKALGEFLVRYSQILIAVWDDDRSDKLEGSPDDKIGGTSDVVAMKLRTESPHSRLEYSRMNKNGAGPVYIVTARRSDSKELAPAMQLEDPIPPKWSILKDFFDSYTLLEEFNSDVIRAGSGFSHAVKESREKLIEGHQAFGETCAMKWVAAVYATADALALKFAKASLFNWRLIFVSLAFAGIFFSFVHAMEGWKLLVAYDVSLLTAFLVIKIESGSKNRGRHEDYRALAEALRVQFFWMAAGLPDLASDNYLRKQSGEMVWIRDAISECALYDGVLERTPAVVPGLPARLRLVRQWVLGQVNYFSRKSEAYSKTKRNLHIAAWILAAIGLSAQWVGLIKSFESISYFELTLNVLAVVAMWWAVLIWDYIERRGFKLESREYERMNKLFTNAAQDLGQFEEQGDFKASVDAIHDLGCEALEENGDWLAMHRERQLPPHVVLR